MPRYRPLTCVHEITRSVTFKVEVDYEFEPDDDGVGPPSQTGNSMTGARYGGRLVPVEKRVKYPHLAHDLLEESFDVHDDEFVPDDSSMYDLEEDEFED